MSTDTAHVGATIHVCIRPEEEMKGTGEWNIMAVRNTVQMDRCTTFWSTRESSSLRAR